VTASALLILNRASGTGHVAEFVETLGNALRAGHGAALEVETMVVDNHSDARSATSEYAQFASRPALVIAAGGGGTLRAVVEGVMDAFTSAPPPADVLRLGALRMGSGNVVARNLRIPLDPIEAARQVGRNFADGTTRACGVIRCTYGTKDGGTDVRHAVTMCGLGQWGRVPGDIARWRERHAAGRSRAASLVGLERVNGLEYVAFGAARLLAATVVAGRCELVEIDGGQRIRLLAAVALNMPLRPLPDPGVAMGDEAFGLIVAPRLQRPFRRRLEPGQKFELRLLDRDFVEFFLDEDPELAFGWLSLETAGLLKFVPGAAA
jgi:diacylglycerol kinase family enzyme